MQVWSAELVRDKTEVDRGKEIVQHPQEIIADATPLETGLGPQTLDWWLIEEKEKK